MTHQKPKILSTNIVAESRLFKIESVALRFSNGIERTYERMKGGGHGAVMMVPVDADNNLILIREYAVGTDSYELGFPKGAIDKGETALIAANRELMEEIGYGAKTLSLLKEVNLAPSYFSARMQIYLAQDLYPESCEGDEPEPLEIIKWPLARANELLDNDEITESRAICALLLALKQLDK
ncbi:ADP compounds hydrolase NudE [Moritella viscosa]|uniref:MutT/nudix family protein n=1 Tax=Moritella viscosa TaxID=80854 RepID=A0A090IF09_9GAMM|nr:ADP compounds hydrolase NudE [Moritella viscosa]CED58309.1 ADP compounds hydrolase NudE [Moritella viscosa]SGY94960.1 Putative MutT/nudix family protein [Moritella viscosa]SGZ00138.1 Putative MutT/nudix family protein [Moritella viscosa]SGZ00580.1 Putative MutT/nudix family protein [Moritella viscosa]SGZ06585.1 Putative MutT/nudix family protein [Moritella viscosa]